MPNLRNESLIAQRGIYDSIKLNGGITSPNFDKEFLSYMRKSYQRYQEALKNKKDGERIDEEKEREKRLKALKIKELEEKKQEVAFENFLNEKADIKRELRQYSKQK